MASMDRRAFLRNTGVLGVAGLAAPAGVAAQASGAKRPARRKEAAKKEPEEEISAPEDLMREHGVLNRILLVYEEGLRRLRDNQEVAPEAFHRPAALVRNFVEDYHERLEERFIFPPFEQRRTLTDLVSVLRRQHEAGRRLTEVVLRSATADQFGKPGSRDEIARSCESFIRMYRPHEAREDTVLFPALYKLLGAAEVKRLGERFEEEEHRLFGEEGFEKNVEQVARVEKELGIYDLAAFTPR
jgi:hemerythrin-like domain-containing protein